MTLDWVMVLGGFLWGFVFGAMWQVWVNRQNLISKAQPEHRTAEKIGDGFYYIVPESEYVQMTVIKAPTP